MRTPVARVIALIAAIGIVVLAATLSAERPKAYVVTAIDYHFHDAHPTFPIRPGRDLVIKNAGRNVHNVTIPALEINEDVAPGGQFTIEDIADLLEPGRYELFCRLHLDRGMRGVIVIAGV